MVHNVSRLTLGRGAEERNCQTGQISDADGSQANLNFNTSIINPTGKPNEPELIGGEDSSKLSDSSARKDGPKGPNGEDVCRICLGTEEEGNPEEPGGTDKLICPCKCAGSMGLIHVSCLKEWVNSKRLVYKGKKVQSFFWKALECELC